MPAKTRPGAPLAEKPGLTRERVVQAALDLVDARGLDELTMRSLGEALSVEAMSLYRYFPSKADLLAGIADRVLGEIEYPAPTSGWRRNLEEGGLSFWRALVAHPNAVPLLFMTPSDTPGSRAAVESALRTLARAGFTPGEAHQIFRIFQAFVFGSALMYSARAPAEVVRKTLAALHADGQYPLLRAALSEAPTIDHQADFARGLARLLDGIEASRRPRKAPRRVP